MALQPTPGKHWVTTLSFENTDRLSPENEFQSSRQQFLWFRGRRSPSSHTLPTLCTARLTGKGTGAATWAEPRYSQNQNLAKARARSGVGLCFQAQPLATSTETPGWPPPQTPAGQHGTRRLGAHSGWVGAGRPSPHRGPELKKAPSTGLPGEDRRSPGGSRVQPHLPGRPPCLPLHAAPEFGSAGSRPAASRARGRSQQDKARAARGAAPRRARESRGRGGTRGAAAVPRGRSRGPARDNEDRPDAAAGPCVLLTRARQRRRWRRHGPVGRGS